MIKGLHAQIQQLKASQPSSSKPFVPIFPDNDYYTPGRAGIVDPQRPRLLPLNENDRVYRALLGQNSPDRPGGKVLEWITVASVATYLADFAAYWGDTVSPALEKAGLTEIGERCDNTLAGIFGLVEGRYDYLTLRSGVTVARPRASPVSQ